MSDAFAPKSDFLAVLMARGFLHQCSDLEGIDAKAKSGDLVGYIGFDCTAPSLHAGSLVPIMMLRWLQKTGGKPIALVGGGTTRVGDPSGKDESRKLLSLDDIETNKQGIKRIFSKFLKFGDGKHDALMPDNAEWLAKLNYIDFLRDVGRHFSVNRMLAMDSVKLRLEREHELSFIEFNYMCLQAYDFVELNRRYNCVLQMGGSDQWGNIVTGIDLGRRMGTPQLYGSDLAAAHDRLRRQDGQDGGGRDVARSRHAERLRLLAILAQLRGRRCRPFSQSSSPNCRSMKSRRLESLRDAEINEAKKILATEATAMVHGREAAEQAAETARQTFEEGALGESLPSITVEPQDLADGLGVLAAFVQAGLVTSTSEARRQVKGGGLKVNDDVVTDERAVLSNADLIDGAIKLSLGKKKHVLLKPAR